jgi:DNA-binding NarL/FixJ family response regulator
MPYEIAAARMTLGLVCRSLGDEHGAAVFFDTAVEIFTRLGAIRDVEITEALRAGSPDPAPRAELRRHGLSAREVDVVVLLATGATNQQIADELCISRKTVARHLSNIFTKIDVSSRAAATAFAFEHGLARPR